MNKSDFYYDLPKELIAQTPAPVRDLSRLLVYHRDGGAIEHKVFRDVIDYLNPNDVLVVNETRVLPARLIGQREDTGGAMEFLLLKRLDKDRWETLVKPGKRAKTGVTFSFGDGQLRAVVEGSCEDGGRIVRFLYDGVFEELLMNWVRCPCRLTSPNAWKTKTAIRRSMLRKRVPPPRRQPVCTSRRS